MFPTPPKYDIALIGDAVRWLAKPWSEGVLSNPERKNVGRTAVISRSGQAPVTICDVRGSDDVARQLSIIIKTELEGGGLYPATAFPHVVALVEWGIGGFQTAAEVDVGAHGTVISVAASFVRISARIDLNVLPVPGAGVLANPLKVGAFVGYQTRPGRDGGPTRTLAFTVADAAFSPNTEIPAFARFADVGLDAFGGLYELNLLNAAGTTVIGQTSQAANPSLPVPIYHVPIPIDAVRFNVNNKTGNQRLFRVMFGIAL